MPIWALFSSSAKTVRSLLCHALLRYVLVNTGCWIAHPISRPHTSQNLIELYGLNSIAASVARTDPVTGEKINKLRKSYEGKVKNLQIAGKNKAVKVPDEFTNLLQWPEQEWHNQKVHGKSAMDGLSGDLLGMLDRAVQMAPGKLPAAEADKIGRAHV